MSLTLAQILANTALANINAAMGEQADTESKSVVLSTGSKALLTNIAELLTAIGNNTDGLEALLGTLNTSASSTAAVPVAVADEYEVVAASQTDQVIGATGATGDRLAGLLINPATISPGNVILKDGTTVIYTFAGGTDSVSDLGTRPVPLGLKSISGAWKVTTGANVSVIAVGDFT